MGKDADRASKTWEAWALADPQYAILSSEEVSGWDEAKFMAHNWEVQHALNLADKVSPVERGNALDFGCGMGRLTQGLAEAFDTVTGVDLSPTMVREAGRLNRHPGRCQYLCVDLDALPDAQFDFALAVYVIQHIPGSLQPRVLRNLVRVLRPGGLAVIQVHGGWPGLRGIWQRTAPRPLLDLQWRARHRGPRIEMNPLSRAEVRRIIAPATIAAVHGEWYVIRPRDPRP